MSNVDDWFVFHTQLEDEWFEKQANWFPGGLLVPKAELLVNYKSALAAAISRARTYRRCPREAR